MTTAAKSQNQGQASVNAYMLVSILPEPYRTSTTIGPSKVQSPDGEASYVGLYTTIIAIITLAGGELSDPRLRRYLARLNASENMPSLTPNSQNAAVEKTDVMLSRMIKQGYLVKVTEAKVAGDEESTTWHVGPRGKTEVDNEAIASVVRIIYGRPSDELEKQLQTSLKVRERKVQINTASGAEDGEEDEEQEEHTTRGPSNGRRTSNRRENHGNGNPGPSNRRSSRRQQEEEDEEQDEEDEEDGDMDVDEE
jgi:hypothetical protein